MNNTSEIWVTSLELDEKTTKSDSRMLMRHYSKLPEIFTRFWWLNFVTMIIPLCSNRFIVLQIVVRGSSSVDLISFSNIWPPLETISCMILRSDSRIDFRMVSIDFDIFGTTTRSNWFNSTVKWAIVTCAVFKFCSAPITNFLHTFFNKVKRSFKER